MDIPREIEDEWQSLTRVHDASRNLESIGVVLRWLDEAEQTLTDNDSGSRDVET